MSAFVLKMIALVCMVIDHTGAVFYMDTPQFFRYIGRIAFPIFAFLIAEGCSHTKDMKKYLIRLGAFALISEVPFDLAFAPSFFPNNSVWSNINFLYFTNVFYTMFLGAFAVFCHQLIFKRLSKTDQQHGYNPRFLENIPAFAVSCLPLLPIALLAEFMGTDYASFGVLLIFCTYIARTKKLKLIVVAVGVIYKYGGWIWGFVYYILSTGNRYDNIYFPYANLYYFLAALVSVVCIYFYNGKRGKPFKWAFYIIYPAHLLLFSGIYFLLYT